MAIFQRNDHHPDETPKRRLSKEDVLFLKTLQHEMNTQSGMGNADPVFWVLKGTKAIPCDEAEADAEYLMNADGSDSVSTMDEAIKELRPGGWLHGLLDSPVSVTPREGSNEYVVQACGSNSRMTSSGTARNLTELLEVLADAGLPTWRLTMSYTKDEGYIYPDTLFLTHKAAQDHLQKYHYNYSVDTHAFAMTAVRSPEVERLYDILRHINLNALEAIIDKTT